MTNSSQNWQTYKFGDMVHHIGERVDPAEAEVDIYVGLEHLDPESLKIRRHGVPSDVGGIKLRFYPGDIIFGKRRFYQRKLAVADFHGICSAHAMVLRAKPDVVLPEFLPFFMQSETFYQVAMSISVGSLSPTINWTTMKKQKFALPPLDEQRRIAEILWAVEDVIETYKTVLHEAHIFRRIRTRKLFLDVRQTTSLESLTQRITYGFTNPMPTTDDGPWMVTATNVIDGEIDYQNTRHTSQQAYDEDLTGKSRPDVGDILLTKDGTLGRVAVVDNNNICINQSVARIVPIREEDSKYIAYYLRSPSAQHRMIAEAGGTTIKHIYITRLSKMAIPYPEQSLREAITREIDKIYENERHVNSHINHLSKLKNKLLFTLLENKSYVQ